MHPISIDRFAKMTVKNSPDKNQKLWLCRPEDFINEACARLTHNLSKEEKIFYLPDEHYRQTCPNLPAED